MPNQGRVQGSTDRKEGNDLKMRTIEGGIDFKFYIPWVVLLLIGFNILREHGALGFLF